MSADELWARVAFFLIVLVVAGATVVVLFGLLRHWVPGFLS